MLTFFQFNFFCLHAGLYCNLMQTLNYFVDERIKNYFFLKFFEFIFKIESTGSFQVYIYLLN